MRPIAGVVSVLLLVVASVAPAEILFYDDFREGAAQDWGNEFGDWVASGGVYFATAPSTSPPGYTSVTCHPELTDFTVEFDINGANDGGVFLRSHRCENGEVEGVLFLVGGWEGTYQGVYWHIWDCSGHGSIHNSVEIPGIQGSNVHVLVTVQDSVYSAFIDGGSEPVSTLVTSRYSSGSVALYQYFEQSFDNVCIYSEPVSGIGDVHAAQRLVLVQNSPNPFCSVTKIAYDLPERTPVDLRVFDVSGRLVRVLLRGDVKELGIHETHWDGCDDAGRRLAAGVYFYRLDTGTSSHSDRIVLLR